jgi:hypothetical protein
MRRVSGTATRGQRPSPDLDQRVVGICEALQLIEVEIEDDGPLAVDDPQRSVLQKADITFVVPAKYVIALLEAV